MSSLTRWMLAHKRLVVIFWVALTLVGMASAGSATQALKQKFSVPGREGWVTNRQITRDFRGPGASRSGSSPDAMQIRLRAWMCSSTTQA